jgi:hypothetical protein
MYRRLTVGRICGWCNGSGESMYGPGRCLYCYGSGTGAAEEADDSYDAWKDREIDVAIDARPSDSYWATSPI